MWGSGVEFVQEVWQLAIYKIGNSSPNFFVYKSISSSLRHEAHFSGLHSSTRCTCKVVNGLHFVKLVVSPKCEGNCLVLFKCLQTFRAKLQMQSLRILENH